MSVTDFLLLAVGVLLGAAANAAWGGRIVSQNTKAMMDRVEAMLIAARRLHGIDEPPSVREFRAVRSEQEQE